MLQLASHGQLSAPRFDLQLSGQHKDDAADGRARFSVIFIRNVGAAVLLVKSISSMPVIPAA